MTPSIHHRRAFQKGQAMSELVIMLPLFLLLIGAAISVGYVCWQGLKVQQAANFAARIQGQERVSGGTSRENIQFDNGVGLGFGDVAPQVSDNRVSRQGTRSAPPARSVYGRLYKIVRGMFGDGEQSKLYILPPKVGINSDSVAIVRMVDMPRIMGLDLPPVKLEGVGYGGEDPHMYGLPRWGRVRSNDPFYIEKIKNPDNR